MYDFDVVLVSVYVKCMYTIFNPDMYTIFNPDLVAFICTINHNHCKQTDLSFLFLFIRQMIVSPILSLPFTYN